MIGNTLVPLSPNFKANADGTLNSRWSFPLLYLFQLLSHIFPHFSSPTKWECVTFISSREEKLRGVRFQTRTCEASISARVSRTPVISVPLSELTVQSAWETTTETHLPQSRRWKLTEQYWNSQVEKKNTHLWYNTLIPSASGLAHSFPSTFSK